MLYTKAIKRVNPKSYHKKNFFSFFFCIYVKRWMFTKLIVVITS